ncbi:hypothetical protein INT47_005528 [Mucor saturninus]|uniref:Uncharacterized protein n=1 Tax=Mucor saturninus TaxID=64648 RepID=A0A8H7RGJ1_9FUNG|nr:hypothetical protein INT47_005528 [Mucor saturninus]
MIDNMIDRSLADKVYVLVSSLSSFSFKERDLNEDNDIKGNLEHVNGSTQDMFEYLQFIDHEMCLASIDFAGIASIPHNLLGFTLPPKHRPGTDLMSKTLLKDSRVVNMIVSTLVAKNGEWLDGKRADVLLIPTTVASESLSPILVEIQNVVDKPYMHRLTQYCSNIYDENNNIEPIALAICIKNVRVEISNMFYDRPKASYLKQLPCNFWAREHSIMTPKTIADYIDNQDNKDSNNDDNNDKDSSNSSQTSNSNINNNSHNNDNDSGNDNDSNNYNSNNNYNNSNNDKNITNENDTSTNSKPLPPLAAV